jgi:ABC-type Fe3+ transport system permease subunit
VAIIVVIVGVAIIVIYSRSSNNSSMNSNSSSSNNNNPGAKRNPALRGMAVVEVVVIVIVVAVAGVAVVGGEGVDKFVEGDDEEELALDTSRLGPGSGGWIVATGALGTGVNIEGIVYVVHVDRPYRLTSFV